VNIGYVRVSSVDQNTGRQLEILAPCGIEKYFEEKVSGKDLNRPQLKSMLDFAREGDIIYVESISRLARNTLDLLNIVDTLRIKNVGLVSIKESIDTSSPTGQFMLSVFGALSQLERDTIRQRQREGIDLALAQNRPYGRPKIQVDSKFAAIVARWRAGEITATEAIRLTGLKRNTFYNRVRDLDPSSTSPKL